MNTVKELATNLSIGEDLAKDLLKICETWNINELRFKKVKVGGNRYKIYIINDKLGKILYTYKYKIVKFSLDKLLDIKEMLGND